MEVESCRCYDWQRVNAGGVEASHTLDVAGEGDVKRVRDARSIQHAVRSKNYNMSISLDFVRLR